jgi:hypothetical protein
MRRRSFSKENAMRWSEHRDGCVAVFGDTDDDMLIIEPVVTAFTPDGWCDRCNGALGFRCATDGANEIFCLRCHSVRARLNLGTRVHG